MGIQLGPLLETRRIKIEELSGQRIAIDGFNVLYQFLTSIRQAYGSLLFLLLQKKEDLGM